MDRGGEIDSYLTRAIFLELSFASDHCLVLTSRLSDFF